MHWLQSFDFWTGAKKKKKKDGKNVETITV